jgi:hypothetical protein
VACRRRTAGGPPWTPPRRRSGLVPSLIQPVR